MNALKQWSTTCDASKGGALKAGDRSHRTGRWRHLARDADMAAGFVTRHRNKDIDPERTARLNESWVNDGAGGYRAPKASTRTQKNGKVVPVRPSAEFDDYLESRLATVTKTIRKDAVAIRGFVFKIDPEWFERYNPDWRTKGLNAQAELVHGSFVKWAEQFMGGQSNVVGWFVHADEGGYPEIQLMATPVTEDGRLAQKDFFPDPASMSQMHRDLRNHLRDDVGYLAEMTVKETSKVKRNTEALKRATAEIEAERAAVKAAAAAVAKREKLVEVREEGVDADYETIAAARDSHAQALGALRVRETSVEASEGRLEAKEAALVARERAAAAALVDAELAVTEALELAEGYGPMSDRRKALARENPDRPDALRRKIAERARRLVARGAELAELADGLEAVAGRLSEADREAVHAGQERLASMRGNPTKAGAEQRQESL